MTTIAFILIFIGIATIALGLLMTINIFGMAPSRNIREHADITEPDIQRKNGRVLLIGLAFAGVGFLLMWAST